MTCRRLFAICWCAVSLLTVGQGVGQSHSVGASIRGYQFLSSEDLTETGRNDAEFWLFRVTDEASFGSHVSVEVHGLMTFLSPAIVGSSRVARAEARNYLPLQSDLTDCRDIDLLASFDRMNVQLDFNNARLTVGRQAVTWGVSYFWPALDLFAPFAPQQLDREYKAGVDAVRLTVPLGSFSELEVLGGVLGDSFSNDAAAGALLRWNLGSIDIGFMGGKFHGDKVAGFFATANLRGTGLRGEVAYTDSGDLADAALDREAFWRGSVGIDRQLAPSLNLVFEVAYNGYGAGEAARYPLYFASDRIGRGEINGLGRLYGGAVLTWLLHPLWVSSQTLMVNVSDGSLLWVPSVTVSTGDNSDLILGAQLGIGSRRDEFELPQSEYGATPAVLFGALRFYF